MEIQQGGSGGGGGGSETLAQVSDNSLTIPDSTYTLTDDTPVTFISSLAQTPYANSQLFVIDTANDQVIVNYSDNSSANGLTKFEVFHDMDVTEPVGTDAPPSYSTSSFRGTYLSPTPISIGDNLGRYTSYGSIDPGSGLIFDIFSQITTSAAGSTSANPGGAWVLSTKADNGSLLPALYVTEKQNLGINVVNPTAQLEIFTRVDIPGNTYGVGMNITGDALPSTSASNGAPAQSIMNVFGATGQETSFNASNSKGGVGGSINYLTGNGGANSDSNASTNGGHRGGVGGGMNFTGGVGGASTGTGGAHGGSGGSMQFTGGTGGFVSQTAIVTSSGAGGPIVMLAGQGGSKFTTGTSGAGGSITIDAGAPGLAAVGATTGALGTISIGGFNAGTVTIGGTVSGIVITPLASGSTPPTPSGTVYAVGADSTGKLTFSTTGYSNTLAAVSVASTNATTSKYTMTASVPVDFVNAAGTTTLMRLNESNGRINFGSTTSVNSRVTITGTGSTDSTRSLSARNSSNVEVLAVLNGGTIQGGIVGVGNFVVNGGSGAITFNGGAVTGLFLDAASLSQFGDINLGGSGNIFTVDDFNGYTYADNTAHNLKFGINTSTPDGALNITGGQTWTAAGWQKGLRLNTINAIEFGGGSGQPVGLGASGANLYLFTASGETAGASITYNMHLDTNTGNFYWGGAGSPNARMHIVGAGSTSATRTLTVQNSATTDLFFVKDDGSVQGGIGSSASFNVNVGSKFVTFTAGGVAAMSLQDSDKSANFGDFAFANNGTYVSVVDSLKQIYIFGGGAETAVAYLDGTAQTVAIGDVFGAGNSTSLTIDDANKVSIFTSPVRFKGFAIASLPSGTIGDVAYVNNATVVPAKGVAPVAGGTAKGLVWFDGAAWVGV